MEEPVQEKTFGSCTIKRNGSIVKGTRGNRIANLAILRVIRAQKNIRKRQKIMPEKKNSTNKSAVFPI